jgi:tetratricopeptide (TPR) repeat protein
VGGDTYNYYTYNNYYDKPSTGVREVRASDGRLLSTDENSFADVREKLAAENAPEPEAQTDADVLFDEGVNAFAEADYDKAVEKFNQARLNSPEDKIMPFALSQAMFAAGRYTEAAAVLRAGLEEMEPGQEGVFYPRGLYEDDQLLLKQIDLLKTNTQAYSDNPDLNLLLGYHLLGTGNIAESKAMLANAAVAQQNTKSAEMLLELADKIPADDAPTN